MKLVIFRGDLDKFCILLRASPFVALAQRSQSLKKYYYVLLYISKINSLVKEKKACDLLEACKIQNLTDLGRDYADLRKKRVCTKIFNITEDIYTSDMQYEIRS